MQFTPFPLLPAELRSKIWRAALLERNSIIELRILNNIIIPASRPLLFRINRESRGEAITALSNSLLFPIDQATQNRLYVLLGKDILYLSRNCYHQLVYSYDDPEDPRWNIDAVTRTISLLATSLSNGDRAKIQNLAIDMYEWFELDEPEAFIQELYRFQGLRTLVVVLRLPKFWNRSGYGGNRVFVEPTWGDRKEVQDLEEKMWDIFRVAKKDRPQWKEPNLEIVYLEGDKAASE